MAKVKAFVTPPGKAMWAFLLEPNTRFNQDKPKFEITVAYEPNDPKLKEMLDYVQPFYDAYIDRELEGVSEAKRKKMVVPIVQKELNKEGEETGRVVIKAKQFATTYDGEPRVLNIADSKGKTIEGFNVKVGNGSIVRLKVWPKTCNVQGKVYCTLWINAVQILDLIEYKPDVFEATTGGYVHQVQEVVESTEEEVASNVVTGDF
ncbi:MAG: hypothetical protein DSZ04_00310 [Sulfurimonas sp.]|nr:MAG: hypothetical protein DSZ04_00310 [Sulfurimonas sp.]